MFESNKFPLKFKVGLDARSHENILKKGKKNLSLYES